MVKLFFSLPQTKPHLTEKLSVKLMSGMCVCERCKGKQKVKKSTTSRRQRVEDRQTEIPHGPKELIKKQRIDRRIVRWKQE